jgi:hypothetical protein
LTAPPTYDPRFPQKPLNGCSGCRQDFTSLRLFDAHRVGVYAYPWSPDREDGRRCLDAAEMLERGWEQDERGRWINPAEIARGKQALAKSQRAAVRATSQRTEGEEEAA